MQRIFNVKYFSITIALLLCTMSVNGGNFDPTKRGKILRSKEAVINTVVIPSRNHMRMQPEIYYAFKDTAKKEAPFMEMHFNVFNPFLSKKLKYKKIMKLLNKCVPEVLSINKGNLDHEYLFDDILDYIKKNPGSNLAEIDKTITEMMKKNQFLIIESSDTYGVHPMFYSDNVTTVEYEHGAVKEDIIEALYDLLFIDAALKQGKIIWGTCHGSQAGYIHAGGKLGRIFEFKEGGYGGLVLKVKKSEDNPVNEEVWRLGKSLFTKDKIQDDYGIMVYPVPRELKGGSRKRMYINKDFQHSFGLVAPIPKNIKVLSYHPLSNYKDKLAKSKIEVNEDFAKSLKNQVIVDAYKYKTMLGTQFHPQYTYDDLETSIIFRYLVRQLRDKYFSEKNKEPYKNKFSGKIFETPVN